MRRATNIDSNHQVIVSKLRQCGVSVQPLHATGNGLPDLLVGYRGHNVLLEIKSPTAPIRKAQLEWLAKWGGQATIVYTWEQAMAVVLEACGEKIAS